MKSLYAFIAGINLVAGIRIAMQGDLFAIAPLSISILSMVIWYILEKEKP